MKRDCQLNVVCQLHDGQKQTRGEHGAVEHERVRMRLGFRIGTLIF